MDLSAASWVNLALQIPLALVIVFLVIRFLAFVKEIITAFLEHLKDQRQLDRQQTSDSMNRLTDQLRQKSQDEIRELSALTQKVDGVIDKVIFVERLMQSDDKK